MLGIRGVVVLKLKGLNSTILRRTAPLLALAAMLTFSVSLPNQVMALWLFDQRDTPKATSILPAQKIDTTDSQAIEPMSQGEGSTNPKSHQNRTHEKEITSLRTPFTSTYLNKDGTKTLEYSMTQQNFKNGSSWGKIDNSLSDNSKTVDPNFFQIITNTAPDPEPATKFEGKAGLLNTTLSPLGEGVKVSVGDKSFVMKPRGAKNVTPVKSDDTSVIYKDAWPNIDIEYQLRGEQLKETIVVKDESARSDFDFDVTGGKVIAHPKKESLLTVEGMPEDFNFSTLTVDVNGRGVISEQRASQQATEDGIKISLDKDWLRSQPSSAFPIKIDPGFVRDATSYWMYKSDGYSCNASVCYANTGGILDGSWKFWRTYFQFPYSDLAGKKVQNAYIHGTYKNNANGTTASRYINVGHASCIGYHCTGTWLASTPVSTDFNLNITGELQNNVNAGNYGAVWSLWGEEGAYTSFKPYYNLTAYVTYDTPTPIATPVEPADKQVTITTQPTLRVNAVSDADGDAVKYYYRVSTSPDAETGAVINSGWLSGTQWTVPEGILQDGTTYYWHVYTLGATQTNPNWVRTFRVDLRSGKDSTQSYDTVGPIGVDLATGNVTTSTDTHSMNALGGSIGLSLNYNTPTKAGNGLVGEYWSVAQNYAFASGAPSSQPNLVRNDSDLNFTWNADSPGSGVSADWFYARWKGYFVAPATGAYTFGGTVDDNMAVYVNDQKVFERSCCGALTYDGATPVQLTAGQVVPLRVEYLEIGGYASIGVMVKGAVAEQPLKTEWLRSEVVASQTQYGLTGRYYTDDGTHNFPTNSSDPMRFMMSRKDSKLAFNWGSGGPAAGLQADNFMAKWTGYITVPASGSYTFGAGSDDGVRIKLNNGFMGAEQTVLNAWQPQATVVWGSATSLTAGQQVPITVDYFEYGGGAQFTLMIRDTNGVEQEMPVKWLTPAANPLPAAWQLGVDVDGDVRFERLRAVGNNVVLEDSTRETHEYTWTGGGFKPPVNEDGQLTRNPNNTYTLIDSDGRTYVFDAEGKLTSVTTPSDDRNPASIKYTYGGSPSRLLKISDGVTNTRYGDLFYKSINDDSTVCPVPSGFQSAPDGMLCAYKTNDGDITRLFYKDGQLSRITRPGGEQTDYGYDSFGRIISVREPIANDAIAASVRTDDDAATTQLTYDQLGRISTVKAPAPTAAATRVAHSFEYVPSATLMHLSGASEPNGFSKKVEYDNLLRTTQETDLAGLASQTEWDSVKDLQLSTTTPTGLKSTTIYDGEDRPIESYGPAPSAWFGIDRKPTATYASDVPKTTTGFDEEINGPSISYFAYPTRSSSVLSNGQVMYRGQEIWSTDGRFRFTYQTDGNVVLYGPSGWTWHISKAGVASNALIMQYDGNLVLYNGSTPVWYSGTAGAGSKARLVVQNDGNTIIQTDTAAYWTTGTGGQIPGIGNTSLQGAPLLNATSIGTNTAQVSNTWTSSPLPSGSNYWGARMTGKLYLPTTGNWQFRIVSDGGVRLTIDDVGGINDWQDGLNRSHPVYTFNNTANATTPHRITIDYYHLAGPNASFMLYMTPPGGAETANVAQYIKPGYSLQTSQTAYDSQLGDVTSTTTYSKPEYGLVSKTSIDPAGLNLETQATYETPGSGFLRQLSKTLPGGSTTTYQHYAANDTRDNPCTQDVEAFHQAGRPQGKIEADPDGAGSQTSRTSETIYNESGDVVAARYNNDDWTCNSYDSRGRIVSTVVPAIGSKTGRTISNNYAVGGNPLVTSSSDSSGMITVENDLLGRTIKYTDSNGNVTTNNYDQFGKLTSRSSPVGTESYDYDTYDRLTTHKLDGVTFATVDYDQYSRVASVQYPDGISLSGIGRDSLQRENSTTFTYGGNQTVSDAVNFYTSGDIKDGIENGVTKSYQYDKGGRLTSATIGSNTFDYSFSASDASCAGVTGNNPNAGKSGNRTKLTLNGVETIYCYDQADRLVTSSDATLTNAQYDTHGNTTSLGDSTHQTDFGYDSSDRNVKLASGTNETTYTRDVQDRIVRRTVKQGGSTTSDVAYGFTGSGDTPDVMLNANGDVIQKYLTLPGDVIATIKPGSTSAGATTFSLPNLHGDIFATINADGALIGKYMTGPFGEVLPATPTGISANTPTNTADGTSYGYVGQHEKMTDTESSPISGGIIQMGARAYLPMLGRFLRVDPTEGGTSNNYAYVNDPVNDFDLDGNIAWLAVIAAGVYLGFAAGATYEAYNNPTPGNIAWAAVAWIPGAGLGGAAAKTTVKAMAPKMIRKAVQYSAKIGGGFKAGIGKAAAKAGQKAYDSKVFGRKSPLFGSKSLGAPKHGILNNNDFLRFGWGNAPKGTKALRGAIGPKSWKGRPHFDIFRGRYK